MGVGLKNIVIMHFHNRANTVLRYLPTTNILLKNSWTLPYCGPPKGQTISIN